MRIGFWDECLAAARMKILLIGGYGSFGRRIVELLKHEAGLVLLVAGRSIDKAKACCAMHSDAQAELIALRFDRASEVDEQLNRLEPTWVVDASGPFQAYGEQSYDLIKACIAARIHYLDLADGSAFVKGVGQFDQAAKRAGVFVLSGVSSFPVLNAAVVRRLSSMTEGVGFKEIYSIRSGIAPSPYAGVGLNVVKAVAGYAGQAVDIKRDGLWTRAFPFTESRSFVIAVPGKTPLRRLRFSLVDVPDLVMLAEAWPQVREVWVGAAPVPLILHRLLNALAWLVRWRILPSLNTMAGLIDWCSNHVRWGENRGGMFVQVSGLDSRGKSLTREWHLLAEGGDGPFIPAMAVEALVRRALGGVLPLAGARAAHAELELKDYEASFAKRQIFTGFRTKHATSQGQPQRQSLYQGLLGDAWSALPEPVRALHAAVHPSEFVGTCTVERGTNILAKLVAKVVGFPQAGADQAIQVRFETCRLSDGRLAELWVRTVAGQSFSSLQFAGIGREEALICERFGPITYSMAVLVEDAQLQLVLRGWSIFGLPLPCWLGPTVRAFERSDGGRFRFFVEIAHPLVGLIVRYQGSLKGGSA
jgi:Domain of unknown function (DUF4166)/Saccharopine dehydrogenase NADP binding domain